MAQVVLGAVGGAVAGGLGRAVGSALGGLVDRAVINSLSPARQRGPRLEGLRVQSSAEGAPMACVFGRARVTGQLIWAARFRETRREEGGGKAGQKTVETAYSLSFAVALCEGPITGIGRIWADGQPMDMTGVAMRVHLGGPDQPPDSLIEAVEAGETPAYRGTAYVVFEDLSLARYGNRPPQLSFEVIRRVGGEGLDDRLEGVCLIPGAGEFVLAAEPVFRRDGLSKATAENVHQVESRSDFLTSVEQLALRFPNLKRVNLVVGWFGDDLRAGHCRVRPGVERRDKITTPQTWSVAGLGRAEAHLISAHDEAPAYGGTPSDESVRQAVAALKARGWEVVLYPFVFMDIPPGNGLEDPYGDAEQASYPWRGRICGEDGAEAAAQIADLFGGPEDWGLRRLALHYAALVAETGADGLLIGSEMCGVTWTRDADGGHPAVAQYRSLAAECRAIVGPDASLSYAADWSEYASHRPDDGMGDVIFHLDPLWSDPAVDHVAIDWYPPMGDWREGDGGIDAPGVWGADDPAYLAAQVAGGEGFDWHYPDATARAVQARAPIVDGAHGEDWVYRIKDLVGWWSNAHHDRVGGVRSPAATAWAPGMKPIRLTEFGCAAVDRGANAPNLFLDPKSAESGLPPHSTGMRDDRMQKRMLEAVLAHFDRPENNPLSSAYDGRMLQGADAWCWDARPFPAFPAREDIWADAGAWRRGHWLNGRTGGEGAEILTAVLRRGGLEDDAFEVGDTQEMVTGYVIDRPMRTRDAVESLLTALGLSAAERGGRLGFFGDEPTVATLDLEALALDDAADASVRTRTLETSPDAVRVRFLDETADYQVGSAVVRSETGSGGGVDIDLPVVCEARLATHVARQALAEAEAGETLAVRLGPLEALRLEAGDRVWVEARSGAWRIDRIAQEEAATATLAPVVRPDRLDVSPEWRTTDSPSPPGTPFLRLLDLPPLFDEPGDPRLLAAVAGDPWTPMQVWAGAAPEQLTPRGQALRSATVGRLMQPVEAGPIGRWDRVQSLLIRVEGEAPSSRPDIAVLGGENLLALETASGWELVQFQGAEPEPGGLWRLSGLLRGQRGTEAEAGGGAPEGATLVFLNGETPRVAGRADERGLPMIWRAAPVGSPPGGPTMAEVIGTFDGRQSRAWSPVRLRVASQSDGLALSWIGRSPIDLDGWGAAEAGSDARETYRVRLSQGSEDRDVSVVEIADMFLSNADVAAAFPEGLDAGSRAGVAQKGADGRWGPEAIIGLGGGFPLL